MSSRVIVDRQDEDTYFIRVLDEKGNYLIREVYPGQRERKGVTASRESLSTQIGGLNEESFLATPEDIKEVQSRIGFLQRKPCPVPRNY